MICLTPWMVVIRKRVRAQVFIDTRRKLSSFSAFSLPLSPLCSLMLNIFRFLYTSLSLLIAAAVSATCQKIIRGTSMQLPRKSRLLLPSNCTNSQLFIHKYCTEFVKSLTTTTYILKIPSPFIQHAVLLCSAHNIKLIKNHTEQDI